MEEKKIKSEQDEDESKQNKKWIESLGFEHLPVEEQRTDEERWRMEDNLHKFAHENTSKALRKHFDSIFFAETCFLPKIVEMHSLGVMNIFETAPLHYL